MFGVLGLMILIIVYMCLLHGVCQTYLKPLTTQEELIPELVMLTLLQKQKGGDIANILF